MHEIKVTYRVNDEYYDRLTIIANCWNEKLSQTDSKVSFTAESVFSSIMEVGSKWDMHEKISFAEYQAGLIPYEKFLQAKDAWKTENSNNAS